MTKEIRYLGNGILNKGVFGRPSRWRLAAMKMLRVLTFGFFMYLALVCFWSGWRGEIPGHGVLLAGICMMFALASIK